MITTKRSAVAFVLVSLAGALSAGPAVGEDTLKIESFASWETATQAELGEERAGAATASSSSTATATQILISEGSANGGTVFLSNNAINESSMSITSINTGNNVVMTNTLAISIYFDSTP